MRAAVRTSSSVASGRAHWMLRRIVSLNKTVSCGTTATASRSESRVRSRIPTPLTTTAPAAASYRRVTSLSTVLLPLPLPPTIATEVPGATFRETPFKTSRSGRYPNRTSTSSSSSPRPLPLPLPLPLVLACAWLCRRSAAAASDGGVAGSSTVPSGRLLRVARMSKNSSKSMSDCRSSLFVCVGAG
jgi:hypothetical protein